MDLKTFVKESIQQIAEGLNEAKEESEQYGIIVNPSQTGMGNVTKISFSLNVTTENKGGMNLKIVDAGTSTSTANRIEFEIEVVFKGMIRKIGSPPIRKEIK